jgi:hypothetical protein
MSTWRRAGWLSRIPLDRRLVYAVGLLVAVLLAVVLAQCTADDEPAVDEGNPAQARLTPITRFDATSVQPMRTGFCELLPEAAVTKIVGQVTATDSWDDGEAHKVSGRVTDVVHEYGCRWTGNRGDVARAWVFAPRVAPQQARALVTAAERARGCRTVDSHDFGTPSTGLVCRLRGGREASYRGLFVDTWLTCSLIDRRKLLPEETLLKRAGRWCVQVAHSASS